MHASLHFQADRIELLLASHKIPARVTGGSVTPRLIRFHLSTPLSVRVHHVQSLAEEIALALGVPSCRVSRHYGLLQVELPHPNPKPVRLLDLIRGLSPSSIPPLSALLGLDHDGLPLLLHLPSPDVAHILIAGTTGSGKTALARSIIASLAALNSPRSLQLVLVDPKGRGFTPFSNLPHLLSPILSDPDDVLSTLSRLSAEMERRDAIGRSQPSIVLALDELADLVLIAGSPFQHTLTRLTQRGREAGIHLIACTQKPTTLAIGSLIKSNFPVRLVGAVPSAEDAKVASGLPATGAERLLGQGDFLLVSKGLTTRFQAAFIHPNELPHLTSQFRFPALGQQATTSLLPTGTDDSPSLASRLRSSLRLVRS